MTISTRKLGRTGTDVTILGYGAMELRGQPRGPAIDDDEAGRLLNEVLDSGVSLIDTSVDYGRSEELIGRYIGHRRDEYFLASKCGCLLNPPADAAPPYPHDYRPANVRADVEQSLRRLGTDRLDLVQVHMSPSRAQLEADDTVPTLQELRHEGKVRFIGMSGILPTCRTTSPWASSTSSRFRTPQSSGSTRTSSPPPPTPVPGPSSAAVPPAGLRTRTGALAPSGFRRVKASGGGRPPMWRISSTA
jgi:aryl-alcohol dehydrogenase-like predicted oxidoreductase